MANPKGRLVKDEADARACFREMEEKKMTIYSYARSSGIAAWSLYRWKEKLGSNQQGTLVEITHKSLVVEDENRRKKKHPRYELRVGPLKIVVGDDFREETLQRILRMVLQ